MESTLRAALKIEGLTQRELARRTGYREETISRIARGHDTPSPTMKARIAEALGRRFEDLFPQESRG